MTTIDQTSDPMKGRRTSAWMISVIFAATLAYASSASALRPIKDPGDDPSPEPDPTCIPAATGHISASPATVELRPGASPNSTLSWSASVTKDCSSIISFEIDGLRVVSHGKATKSFDRPGTYRYTLTIRTPNGSRQTLATTVVEVKTLFPVTLSEGKKVRPWDIQQFDDRWMYPRLLETALGDASWHLERRNLSSAWELSERMRAMVRMYEITHERRYLDHLRDITEMVLKYRDDEHPTEPHLDEFRPHQRTPMPAWGTSSPDNAWYWRTAPDIAALYSYPIAALARIVAEDPNLQAEYGESALRYTKAVMETFEAYYPDWFARRAGDSKQRFMTSPETRTLLTQEKCDRAYQEALDMKPEPWDTPERLKGFHQQCKDGASYKPGPEPFNVTHEFMMMAIELFRAIDSNFYRRSSADQWVADSTQGFTNFGPFPAINNNSAVAFVATRSDTGQGVFRASDGEVTTIASEQDGLVSFDIAPSINAGGLVAFLSRTNSGSTAIFTGDGRSRKLIADSKINGLFRIGVGSPAINDSGTVAFSSVLSVGGFPAGASIFTGQGGDLSPVLHTAGSDFVSFGNVAINDAGKIVFSGERSDGSLGIFTIRRAPKTIVDTNAPRNTSALAIRSSIIAARSTTLLSL